MIMHQPRKKNYIKKISPELFQKLDRLEKAYLKILMGFE